jgi:hypothetical protein
MPAQSLPSHLSCHFCLFIGANAGRNESVISERDLNRSPITGYLHRPSHRLQPKPDPRTSEPATLDTQLTPSSQFAASKRNARYVRDMESVFVVLRSMTHAVQARTLISSSSAHFGAAHGDPRLPNLKRRLPEGIRKKNQLRRQVATVRTIECL